MKKIKFALKEDFNDIVPPNSAKQYLPEWYRSTPKALDSNNEDIINHRSTFKACMPFMDSMMSGYVFELWQDINIIQDENMPRITWKDNSASVLGIRDFALSGNMPTPIGCHDIHYILKHPLYIKTPPGYSILITNPLNRYDLPFLALSAVVDSDKEPFFPGNYSLFLKKDFAGVVKMGTPLLQIIPFKRDDWSSEIDNSIIIDGQKASKKSLRTISGWYRDNAWSKKKYE